VLVHGSGGVSPREDRWADELRQAGAATFLLDSFTGRGIAFTAEDQSQLSSLAMIGDAYRALELLATHPRIDPARIANQGVAGQRAPRGGNRPWRRLAMGTNSLPPATP
jgi:dienelactone hydrolase